MWMQGSTYSQPRHYEEVGCLFLRSFDRRLSGPQDQSGCEGVKEYLHPSDTWDRTRAVQPVVKRLVAWATWPTLHAFYFQNCDFFLHQSYFKVLGRRLIGISGYLIWSKTLMEPILIPVVNFGEVRKGPVSQIHSPHLHVGCPWDLLRYFKVCSDAKERVGCWKQREATALIYP